MAATYRTPFAQLPFVLGVRILQRSLMLRHLPFALTDPLVIPSVMNSVISRTSRGCRTGGQHEGRSSDFEGKLKGRRGPRPALPMAFPRGARPARPVFQLVAGPDPKSPGAPTVDPTQEEDTAALTRPKAAVPKRYKVLFHNDDFTTMEFVVDVLRRFFHKNDSESVHIMLTVHKKGKAVAGVYTRDVAETKVSEVMKHAREHGMPLLLTTEPE